MFCAPMSRATPRTTDAMSSGSVISSLNALYTRAKCGKSLNV